MNLITDAWIAVRRRSGAIQTISPAEIVSAISEDPIVDFNECRPDFNGAAAQFLIGLLQTCATPGSGMWRDWYESPPSVDELQDAFLELKEVFELVGKGSRYMQDQGLEDAEPKEVASLLLEAPGGQTVRNNADHFIKQGGVSALGLRNAALALLTLQINAPAGGKGFRTSLRGGGPLTTLVAPDPNIEPLERRTLWHLLWLNVLDQDQLGQLTDAHGDQHQALADRFPWLAPCRTSDPKGVGETRPSDAHFLQTYWACPRRIWLEMDADPGHCSLSGEAGPVVHRYRTRNYGANYQGPWEHPLSPYYRTKEGEWLPLHPQPGGIGYRHWGAYVFAREERGRAAAVVRAAKNDFDRPRRTLLWAFGFDMDNMKARAWYEAWMPILKVSDAVYPEFERRVDELLASAERVADAIRSAIKEAWFRPGLTVRGDLNAPLAAFWSATESEFYVVLFGVLEALENNAEDRTLRESWFVILSNTAMRLFDEWAASGDFGHENPKRIAKAGLKLRNILNGKTIKGLLIPREQAA